MKLRERDLEIDFTNAIDAIVFDQMKADQPGYHGIGKCIASISLSSLRRRFSLLR